MNILGTLQWVETRLPPKKNTASVSPGVLGPHLIRASLVCTRVHTPDGISVGSAVLAQLRVVTAPDAHTGMHRDYSSHR